MSQVPWASQDELIWLCCGQCTLDAEREIQIHHIDGDSGNDDPDNWTVLCLNCHAKAQEDLQVENPLDRKYTPDRLKRFRELSIQACFWRRIGVPPIVDENERITEELGRLTEKLPRHQLVEETAKWLNRG